MKYLILLLLFGLISCQKEQISTVNQNVGPIMLKIEAVGINGESKESPIILVR